MQTRSFVGYVRDQAQRGRCGPVARAARLLVQYIRKPTDTLGRLQARVDADLAQRRVTAEHHRHLCDRLDMLAECYGESPQILDVRTSADWEQCGNGFRHVTHREVMFEDGFA